jgi:hypothetical protein
MYLDEDNEYKEKIDLILTYFKILRLVKNDLNLCSINSYYEIT